MPTIADLKKRARAQVRAARAQRVNERPSRDRNIQAHLLDALAKLPCTPSTICAYVPLPNEPGGADLHDALARTGAQVLLPRVVRGDAPSLEWIEYQPDDPNLAAGTWGILEPVGVPVSNSESNAIHTFPTCVDVIITPALSIDYHGIRLGQGGGFYDRTLANRPSHVKIWSVVDHEEFTRDVPCQDHDLVVDAVVNDLGYFPIF
ncbi:5-formyltetrahydrofolate cyclo-ligase [Corynebacterium jeikeium]|uniref:5-formyltetrahydrofolate cyclo-ligase n=1 Tax=Corynebacterium jeikeium TaxID=38289 RepID=UPI00088D2642|nr:5-formyltetrahydrofolate cyclo-ligase [Corynebacterium jeikeium]SCX20924.1 5-formyltetrahydrofolate cyclo-ligase family protein [Corynebacterium jeikeium]